MFVQLFSHFAEMDALPLSPHITFSLEAGC